MQANKKYLDFPDSIYFKEYPKDKIMMQATCDTKLTPLVHQCHLVKTLSRQPLAEQGI